MKVSKHTNKAGWLDKEKIYVMKCKTLFLKTNVIPYTRMSTICIEFYTDCLKWLDYLFRWKFTFDKYITNEYLLLTLDDWI